VEIVDHDEPIVSRLLGKLAFQDLQPVNHMEYKKDVLFVAVGRGGLKIFKAETASPPLPTRQGQPLACPGLSF